jgi:thiopeptide-type bacteriocin biosynthesis protein
MPGLRLRFEVKETKASLQTPLAEWLRAAEWRNDIRGFRFAVYEPESYRFGGEAGMDVAHTHFDAGADLVLSYETLPLPVMDTVSRLKLSVANTTDLLMRCLDDRAEVWDVWQRLLATFAGTIAPRTKPDYDCWRHVVNGFDVLILSLGPEVVSLIQQAQLANEATASALSALADGGLLSVGMRSWLTAASVFEWNRFGLPDESIALIEAITVAIEEFSPDHGGQLTLARNSM